MPDKRKQLEESDPSTVDDLEFAANFAIVQSPGNPPIKQSPNDETSSSTSQETVEESTNAIEKESQKPEVQSCDVSDAEESSTKVDVDTNGISPEMPVQENEKGENDDSKEDSDNESDIDLSEAIREMDENDSEDEGGRGKKKKSERTVPKTQNELDLYNCPMVDLEKRLGLDLDLKSTLIFSKSDPGIMVSCVSMDRLSVAGLVKSHLVSERTIVVESRMERQSAQMTLLDEGSLLVVKVNPENEYFRDIIGEEAKHFGSNDCYIVPLGKVLEVFGPVTRPLYTVRLKSFEDTVNNTKDDTERKEEDPWSINGVLTKLISSEPNMTIYYSEEEAKMVDKETIARNSGKGCDASNVYDEEVQNTDEMYFSDDEQEREARRKGKPKKGQRGRTRDRESGPSRERFERDSGGRGRGHFNASTYNQLQAPSMSYQHLSDQRNQYAQNHYLPNPYMVQQYPSQPQQYMPPPQQYMAQSQQYPTPTPTQQYAYPPQQNNFYPQYVPNQTQQYPNQAQQQVYPQTTQQYRQNTNGGEFYTQGNINQTGPLQNNNMSSRDYCDSEDKNDTVYYDYSGS